MINAMSQALAPRATKNSEENNKTFLMQGQDSPLFFFAEEGAKFGNKLCEKFTNDQTDDCNNLDKVDKEVKEDNSLPNVFPMVKLGMVFGEWVKGLFE